MPKSSTHKTTTQITYDFWLVFSGDGSMKMARGEPDLGRNQRAMAMKAVLPTSLFKTPSLTGSITVADNGAVALKADVKAASEALKLALGVDIDLRISESPTP